MNHPAWVVGHPTFACQLLGGVVDLSERLSDGWAGRFGPGSAPAADESLYGTKDEALAILGDAQARITGAVEGPDDSRLDEPFPSSRTATCSRRSATRRRRCSWVTRLTTSDRCRCGAGRWACRRWGAPSSAGTGAKR
jgi:hypothetical protein